MKITEKLASNRKARKRAIAPEREVEVVRYYLLAGATFRSVGKIFNVAPGTIRRIVLRWEKEGREP